MTTAAFKNGVLSADSAVSAGNRYLGTVNKISLCRDFALVYCGDLDACVAFMEWFERGADIASPPHLSSKADFEFLVIDIKRKRVYSYQNGFIPVEIKAKLHAIGSGGDLAIGAMAAGATPEKAVRIACKYDNYTRPPVRTYKLW